MTVRPALRMDLRVVTIFRGGAPRTIVKDPLAGKYYDFGPAAGRIVRLLDGTRTLEDVRDAVTEEMRGAALPLDALAAFVADLAKRDIVDGGPRAREDRLVARWRRRARERRFELSDIVSWKVPFGDPSPAVDRLAFVGRFLFAPPVVLAVLLLGALALGVVLDDPERFLDAAETPFASGATFLAIAWTLAIGGVLLHELGHALACRRYGGRVEEAGFFLVFGTPCLYTDVSDAWLFPRRAQRTVVTLAGTYIQLITAGAGIFAYALLGPESPVGCVGAAYALASGGGALLCNVNPLIKLDGYYLLADLLDEANLDRHAFDELGRVVGWLLGRELPARGAPPRGRVPLVAYAVTALVYRLGLIVGIFAFFVKVAGASAPLATVVAGAPLLAYRARRKVTSLASKVRPSGAASPDSRRRVRRRLAASAGALALVATTLAAWNPVVSREARIEATAAKAARSRILIRRSSELASRIGRRVTVERRHGGGPRLAARVVAARSGVALELAPGAAFEPALLDGEKVVVRFAREERLGTALVALVPAH